MFVRTCREKFYLCVILFTVNPEIYIGIDDTDNLESIGTGHIARDMAGSLENSGLVNICSITRHQLLVSPEIPYTSHNSAACITGEITGNELQIRDFCSDFLLKHAADGSDVGLCIVLEEEIPEEIIFFGQRAKTEVLKKSEAHAIAKRHSIHLIGLTGEKIGVIGALSAVGLRFQGDDGRVLWLPRLRETEGVYTAKEYMELVPVDETMNITGELLPANTKIMITDWCRPVVRNKKIVLFAEKSEDYEDHEYRTASKEYIKHISE